MTDCKPAMIVDGEPWWLFCFSYTFEGGEYALHIPARSVDEAHERLRKMALARFDGQLHGGSIKVTQVSGMSVPTSVMWKKFLTRMNERW